jgi:site-specific recombinase XerD
LELERGLSGNTILAYQSDLIGFFDYLSKDKEVNLDDLKRKDFSSYTKLLAKNEINPSTITRKIASIKGFFKYLTTKRMMLEENPAANIESPKKQQALPKFLSLDESLLLLESVKNDKESKTKVRDYAIITLFLNCGMRVSELVGIDLNDVDRELRSMTVTGKGNKQRIIYLNDACRHALADYMDERLGEKHGKANTSALFLSNREQRISVKTVQWLVYKYLEQAGLEYKHFSTHKLRHTAATLMYQEGGVDILALKEILGHSQLSTTQIYTHIGDKKLEEAVSKNPLANINSRNIRTAKKEEE